jgi:hypothetical protein
MTNGPNSICSSHADRIFTAERRFRAKRTLVQAALANGPTVAYWDT